MAAEIASAYEKPAALPWGRFEKYSSPLVEAGSWRIGTIADGSCFFHALLTATDKQYRSLAKRHNRCTGESERTNIVSNLRDKLASKLTEKVFYNLQKGEPAFFAFLGSLRKLEAQVLRVLSGHASDEDETTFELSRDRYLVSAEEDDTEWIRTVFGNDKQVMDLVAHVATGNGLLDLDTLGKECSKDEGYVSPSKCDKVFAKRQISHFIKCIEPGIKEIARKYGANTIEKAGEAMRAFSTELTKRARVHSLALVKKHFMDDSQWIGTEFIPFLGDQFNVNIFIVSGDNGLPYLQALGSGSYSRDKGSVFLLAIDDNHYECMGFETDNREGQRPQIRCKVDWSHPVVTKTMALSSRSEAYRQYPALGETLYGKSVVTELQEEDKSS